MSWKVQKTSSLFDALKENNPECSASSIRSWIKQGRVDVSGRTVTDHRHAVYSGTVISLGRRKQFINFAIEILYEDAYVVVIHKPEGILSVGTDYSPYKNVHGFLKRRSKGKNVYPVHRLDRETSGVMMFAYCEKAKEDLKKQFEKHSIQRQYIAIIEGHLPSTKGTWRSFLEEDDTYFVKSTQFAGRGKEAITHYSCIQKSKFSTLIKIELETGKKNQIRVHTSEAGHPVVGDEKYGSKCLKAPRVYLHAMILGFIHPQTQQPMLFERKPSPEFFAGLKQRPFVDPLSQLGS